ncbi:MAG: diol dehydratase reactivase subunit alpha [Thermomicrobiales bacterium]|nr:MAG: diol dehydratase reactivase subunit alpha [Thermomicrobiales bacterium]
MLIAGVDIGNQTTEIAVASVEPGGIPRFLASSLVSTTGIKGTPENVAGVRHGLTMACDAAGISADQIGLVCINEAVPVVAGVAMQTLTETVLTDSAVAGHNPATPGGEGLGVGRTVRVDQLLVTPEGPVIAVVPATIPFEEAARMIGAARQQGITVTGAIVQADDGVLIANRLPGEPIPIVDEVAAIEAIPLGEPAAVEVAPPGATVQTLCNPYGLATIFGLDPATTARIAPAARALTGLRSALVVRLPDSGHEVRRIPAGAVTLAGERGEQRIDLRGSAGAIVATRERIGHLRDAWGDPGTSAGAMFAHVKQVLSGATGQPPAALEIRDLFATDLTVPQAVTGGLSNEVAPERAVALAAMVQTGPTLARGLAQALSCALGIPVERGGSEAEAGILGALTTPGTTTPVAVLDLGSGSTNAARMQADGHIASVHLAGGGAMVNLIIGEELGIADEQWREDLKRCRVAHVEDLFRIRHEDGTLQFTAEPLPAEIFGRTILVAPAGYAPVPGNPPVERVRQVRRSAKRRVFGTNAERALRALAPGGNLRYLDFVVLAGGSAQDFELPGLLASQFAEYGIVLGAANVRGNLGPRNAVATGLVLLWSRQAKSRLDQAP